PPGRHRTAACLRKLRSDAGREDQPFTVMAALETPDVDLALRLLDAGVTDLTTSAWLTYGARHDGVEGKRRALERFADAVLGAPPSPSRSCSTRSTHAPRRRRGLGSSARGCWARRSSPSAATSSSNASCRRSCGPRSCGARDTQSPTPAPTSPTSRQPPSSTA